MSVQLSDGATFCATDMALISAGAGVVMATGAGTTLMFKDIVFKRVEDDTFSRFTGGSVLLSQGARLQADRCHFKSLRAKVELLSEMFVHNLFSVQMGGALYILGPETHAQLTDCKFEDCRASVRQAGSL